MINNKLTDKLEFDRIRDIAEGAPIVDGEAQAMAQELLAYREGNDELVDELQALGEAFGCPGGMQRVVWLRTRLTALGMLSKLYTEMTHCEGIFEEDGGRLGRLARYVVTTDLMERMGELVEVTWPWSSAPTEEIEKRTAPRVMVHGGRMAGRAWAAKSAAAVATLEHHDFTWHGGDQWKPPLGLPPAFASNDRKELDRYRAAESKDSELLRRVAIVLTGSDAPGEIRSLPATAQSYVDRCKSLAAQLEGIKKVTV